MKQARPYPQVVVTRKAARSLKAGHPWVFEGEVVRMEPAADGTAISNGCVVDVFEENGTWQGAGLISQNSKKWLRTSGITAGIPVAAPLHHMDERLMHPEDRGTRWRRVMQAD